MFIRIYTIIYTYLFIMYSLEYIYIYRITYILIIYSLEVSDLSPHSISLGRKLESFVFSKLFPKENLLWLVSCSYSSITLFQRILDCISDFSIDFDQKSIENQFWTVWFEINREIINKIIFRLFLGSRYLSVWKK